MLDTARYRLKIVRNTASKSGHFVATAPPGAPPKLPVAGFVRHIIPGLGTPRRTLASNATSEDTHPTVLPGGSCAETLPDIGRHSTALENERLSFLPALIGIR